MTVLEASNKLYEWFEKNESFSLSKNGKDKDNYKDLLLVSENPNLNKLILKKALKEFEKGKACTKLEDEVYEYWVLLKPFDTYSQTITIEPQVAKAIGNIINEYCNVIENESDRCEYKKITSKDIQNLVILFLNLSKKEDTEEQT